MTAHTFTWRVDDCPECDGSGRVPGAFGSGPYRCDDCCGLGWRDRECVECGEDAKLNSDDVCEDCAGLTEVRRDIDPETGNERVAA